MTVFWQAEARFDWGEYVRNKGGMRALRGRSDEYLMACPDCGKPKLAVNVGRRAWRCFVCGEGGRDAASLVAKVEGLRFGEAMVQVMSGYRGAVGRIDIIERTLEPEDTRRLGWIPKPIPWPEGFGWVSPFHPGHGEAHRRATDYAINRFWPEYAIDAMKLGICASGRFRGRIIFPVFDPGERLIFYQGRATWTPDPRENHIKTLSPRRDNPDEQAGPADCLLNLQYVEAKGLDHVLVVEGPTDAIKAWPDCVATFGKAFSPRQMELLVRAGIKRVDICWDNDVITPEQRARGVVSGYEAALKVAPQLADLFEVRVVCLPVGSDPGELTKDQLEGYRAQAQRWGQGDRLSRIPDTL